MREVNYPAYYPEMENKAILYECFCKNIRLIKRLRIINNKNSYMKKITLLMLFAAAFATTMYAQPGGGFQRQTPEQRVAAIHQKLDSAFKIEPAKFATLDTALTALYKAQDARMQEIFSSGERPDRETMMAERKKYSDSRDEMIKAVLTEDQFTIWKDKIEPSMRPQRPPGGGNN
jgi:periplasmic protein CpxP/Spy